MKNDEIPKGPPPAELRNEPKGPAGLGDVSLNIFLFALFGYLYFSIFQSMQST